MTTIDIGYLPVRQVYDMFDWLVVNYGTIDQGRWSLKDTTCIEFIEDSDATMFLLRWINASS